MSLEEALQLLHTALQEQNASKQQTANILLAAAKSAVLASLEVCALSCSWLHLLCFQHAPYACFQSKMPSAHVDFEQKVIYMLGDTLSTSIVCHALLLQVLQVIHEFDEAVYSIKTESLLVVLAEDHPGFCSVPCLISTTQKEPQVNLYHCL